MWTAIGVIVGAVVAWMLVDRALSWRAARRGGRSAWTTFGADRTFCSTGWEETLPPLEAAQAADRAAGRAA